MITFLSPLSGRPLHHDTPHSLSDGQGERWPMIDGIAYLRTGSEYLAAAALARLDRGDQAGALVLLLAENDRWWSEPPPPPEQLRELIKRRDNLSLRDAMGLLGWGRVGDYFAHRWSDPTYVAGLTLIDRHWTQPASAFELACGIGHYLRALAGAGVRAIGADLVFAKLWVARHWVAPDADLVCFDADQSWPIEVKADIAFCHDAFYFLRNKPLVAKELRKIAPVRALAHIHNSEHLNLSGGHGMTLAEVRASFPGALIYADEALTAAGTGGEVLALGDAGTTEAFGVIEGAFTFSAGPLSVPPAGALLRRNPLCVNGAPAWPSERYAAEYGERATYACAAGIPEATAMAPEWSDAARRRELVDLPERW